MIVTDSSYTPVGPFVAVWWRSDGWPLVAMTLENEVDAVDVASGFVFRAEYDHVADDRGECIDIEDGRGEVLARSAVIDGRRTWTAIPQFARLLERLDDQDPLERLRCLVAAGYEQEIT